jgi:hypothetical protein
MRTPAARPRFVVATEWALLIGVLGVFGVLAARVVEGMQGAGEIAAAIVAIPIGVAIADLGSGIVHWGCDTFLEEDTPFVGPLIIATFRAHHRDPLGITRHGFVERNAISGIAALPPVMLGLMPSASVAVSAAALACASAVLMTNEVHAWAHAAKVPRAVRWLQRRGVILAPERHAMHHRAGVTGYSVTTGWTSGVIDWVLGVVGAPRGAG